MQPTRPRERQEDRVRGTGRGDPRGWSPPPGRRTADGSRWHWLLLLAIAPPLAVPLYNRLDPRLFGVPFYYWCQLAFAGLSALIVAIVHVKTKGR